MVTMAFSQVDLESLKNKILITRVKLGSTLELLEESYVDPAAVDEIAGAIDNMAKDVDRLVNFLQGPSDWR